MVSVLQITAARACRSGGYTYTWTRAARRFSSASAVPEINASADADVARAFGQLPGPERPVARPGNRSTPGTRGAATGGALAKYGRDLTAEATAGRLDPLIGRQDVLERVMRVLMRRTKNNAVLVGEAGVGKTAVAEGVAQLLVRREAPAGFRGKRMISLDAGSLVAGTQYRGAFEERLQAVLSEVRAARGAVLLFVDEIHMLVNAGRTDGSMDAANLLKPALARGELHCLGATTPDEYRKHIESDPAFARRFQPVMVDEPSVEEAALWLYGLRDRYERHHQVEVLDSAVEAAVRCAKRYIPHRRLPDSAIDLLDEAAASARLRGSRSSAPVGAWSPEMRHKSSGKTNGVPAVQFRSSAPDNADTLSGLDLPSPEAAEWPGAHLDWAGEASQNAPWPELAHGSEWGGDVQFSTDQPPRPCPHCAMPVRWQPRDVIQLKCPACGFRFLNLPPEKLMLGSSVLSAPHATDKGGATTGTRVAVADKDDPNCLGAHEVAEAAAIQTDGGSGVSPVEAAGIDREERELQPEEVSLLDKQRRLGEWLGSKLGPKVAAEHIRVEEKDVTQVVSLMTGVSLGDITADEQQRLAEVAAALKTEVVGQAAAVDTIADAIQMGRLGLRPAARPLSSFLFVGDLLRPPPVLTCLWLRPRSCTHRHGRPDWWRPSGVGKTLLAERLAAGMYQDSNAIVRLNGSDLSERASLSRLLGPPPGYVGFGRGGELTEPLRQRPNSLVIVEGVDAAHPEVQELLAQVIESGSLTDSTGREANFTNAILILTAGSMHSDQNKAPSSASPDGAQGAEWAQPDTSIGAGAAAAAYGTQQRSRIRRLLPQLASRLDEVVFFKELGPTEMLQVAQLKVEEAKALAASSGVRLDVQSEVVEALSRSATSAGQGARPLGRLVRQHVLAPLARELMARDMAQSGDGSHRQSGGAKSMRAQVSLTGNSGTDGNALATVVTFGSV